ncbi:phage holin [Bifidobacterium longum]|uniref:phage holin n=1 Tax=Bifidobacterium longum TaxID=216816 RepID=UPI000667B9D5|nr:phage holin [Bifidobacterium longum]
MTDSKNTTDTGETLPGVDVSDWPETADVTHDVPDWLIPSRVYDVLKWLALIVLPAIGVLVQTLGPVWGWTWADPVATTINAVALTIGVVIGASALKAKASKTE